MSKFPLLNALQKKQQQAPNLRMQLELLKQSTKKLIAVHNETVLVLWDTSEQLNKCQRELLQLEKNSTQEKALKRDITELKSRKKILDDALTRHRTSHLIREKMAEIKRLELNLCRC